MVNVREIENHGDQRRTARGEGLFSAASRHAVIGAGNWMVTCRIPSYLRSRFTLISSFQSVYSRVLLHTDFTTLIHFKLFIQSRNILPKEEECTASFVLMFYETCAKKKIIVIKTRLRSD